MFIPPGRRILSDSSKNVLTAEWFIFSRASVFNKKFAQSSWRVSIVAFAMYLPLGINDGFIDRYPNFFRKHSLSNFDHHSKQSSTERFLSVDSVWISFWVNFYKNLLICVLCNLWRNIFADIIDQHQSILNNDFFDEAVNGCWQSFVFLIL